MGRNAMKSRTAKLAQLAKIADLHAAKIEQRLAMALAGVTRLEDEIDDLKSRRATLLASQSEGRDGSELDATDTPILSAYIHTQANALRRKQAILYQDLAKAEVDAAPVRTEAARARARVAALQRMSQLRR